MWNDGSGSIPLVNKTLSVPEDSSLVEQFWAIDLWLEKQENESLFMH